MFNHRLRFGQVLMLLALFLASGGHWLVLQSVAWAGMLVTYSQESGIEEAVTKTFDGNYPCDLCKDIDQAKKTEKKEKIALSEIKAIFVEVVVEKLSLPGSEPMLAQSTAVPSWEQRSYQPPAPPPRLA